MHAAPFPPPLVQGGGQRGAVIPPHRLRGTSVGVSRGRGGAVGGDWLRDTPACSAGRPGSEGSSSTSTSTTTAAGRDPPTPPQGTTGYPATRSMLSSTPSHMHLRGSSYPPPPPTETPPPTPGHRADQLTLFSLGGEVASGTLWLQVRHTLYGPIMQIACMRRCDKLLALPAVQASLSARALNLKP